MSAATLSTRQRVWLALLLVLMGGSGVLHFVAPDGYVRIVPDGFPAPRLTVYLSGLAELACAGLLAVPGTRRVGALATTAVLLAVYPANVWVALEGRGYPFGDGFAGSNLFAWLRLPLQALFVWWAYDVARGSSTTD